MTTTATFAGMDLLGVYIDGAPAAGSDTAEIVDVNPYTDETIVTLQGASTNDVDKAYASARTAQREWAGLTPNKRSKVIARAAELLAERREEIVDWLITESGSTAIKANKEEIGRASCRERV